MELEFTCEANLSTNLAGSTTVDWCNQVAMLFDQHCRYVNYVALVYMHVQQFCLYINQLFPTQSHR